MFSKIQIRRDKEERGKEKSAGERKARDEGELWEEGVLDHPSLPHLSPSLCFSFKIVTERKRERERKKKREIRGPT